MPIFNALKPLIKIMNSLFTSIIRKTPVQTAALNAAKGQEELSCRFDEISLFNGDYLIKKDNFFGLYSASGDIIVPCEFNQISFFNGDYLVKKGNKQSLYNADGQEILP